MVSNTVEFYFGTFDDTFTIPLLASPLKGEGPPEIPSPSGGGLGWGWGFLNPAAADASWPADPRP